MLQNITIGFYESVCEYQTTVGWGSEASLSVCAYLKYVSSLLLTQDPDPRSPCW